MKRRPSRNGKSRSSTVMIWMFSTSRRAAASRSLNAKARSSKSSLSSSTRSLAWMRSQIGRQPASSGQAPAAVKPPRTCRQRSRWRVPLPALMTCRRSPLTAIKPKRSPCRQANSNRQAACTFAACKRLQPGRTASDCAIEALASSRTQAAKGLSRSDSRTKNLSERAYSFQSIWRGSSPGS